MPRWPQPSCTPCPTVGGGVDEREGVGVRDRVGELVPLGEDVDDGARERERVRE